MINITNDLIKLGEKEYASFEAKLSPTINKDTCLGVRVPKIREYEKQIKDSAEAREFLRALPHKFFDENMLHAILLSHVKDFDDAIALVEEFLPFANSWAITDTMCPKIFRKDKTKKELLKHILKWIDSKEEYTVRFAVDVLMTYYMNEENISYYFDLVSSLRSDKYYVNMMIAWYFATALSCHYDLAVVYIEKNKLDNWVHNKAIQKAKESYKISKEHKAYLQTLRK